MLPVNNQQLQTHQACLAIGMAHFLRRVCAANNTASSSKHSQQDGINDIQQQQFQFQLRQPYSKRCLRLPVKQSLASYSARPSKLQLQYLSENTLGASQHAQDR